MAKVSFKNHPQPFYQSLKSSVDQYFQSRNLKKTGNWRLYAKTAILIPMALAIYVFLLAGHYPAWLGLSLSFVLGLTLVGIAFNVMHDACHGSFSSHKWVNNVLSLTMNALGSNATIWKMKHNILHHTYTNIDGLDDDIAKSPVLRHCESQPWKRFHRFQHIYMFAVYSLSTILWLLLTDNMKYFSRKIVSTEMKMSTSEHILFWSSKLLYLFFYAALPIWIVGFLPWLAGYLVVNLTMGLTLAVVFQLAHVVEKTTFEKAGEAPVLINQEWAVHEILTTADFAPGNKLITWFVGGLNYQIEHHLFPRISHIHYPAISRIVREECRKFNLPYNYYPKMRQAVASHIRVMRRLGMGTPSYATAS
jgi:linoleoyl-CoA desaturase